VFGSNVNATPSPNHDNVAQQQHDDWHDRLPASQQAVLGQILSSSLRDANKGKGISQEEFWKEFLPAEYA
jgi:hypothetical protein